MVDRSRYFGICIVICPVFDMNSLSSKASASFVAFLCFATLGAPLAFERLSFTTVFAVFAVVCGGGTIFALPDS